MKVNLLKSNSKFTKKEKIIRLIWEIIWFFVKDLPRPFSKIRIFTLRFFGAKIGKKCLIETGVRVWLPWNLHLGDFVAIGRKVEIYNYGIVEIGSMTVISQYCYLCTGTHDYTHPYMPLTWAPIAIGSETWVSAGTWILPGVRIGSGSVIAARSLVTKDMPDWKVCGGHPCKPIKDRIIDEPKAN